MPSANGHYGSLTTRSRVIPFLKISDERRFIEGYAKRSVAYKFSPSLVYHATSQMAVTRKDMSLSKSVDLGSMRRCFLKTPPVYIVLWMSKWRGSLLPTSPRTVFETFASHGSCKSQPYFMRARLAICVDFAFQNNCLLA
jgi:hypothetical protein